MLKLNRQQMESFREANARSFEKRMVAHLAERFPLRSAALGAAGVLRVIQKGIGGAALHGSTRERDVCRLIELMCASDDGRAAEPDDAWMTEVLDNAVPANISARLEQLGALASERLSRPESSGAADPALREEAAAALSDPGDPPFDARASAEDPVTPCPAGKKKRHCVFSS